MARRARFPVLFSQMWGAFQQVRPFRRKSQNHAHNDLTVQGIASGYRPFPDEEGTERMSTIWYGGSLKALQTLPR
jgi:hypothetical protein